MTGPAMAAHAPRQQLCRRADVGVRCQTKHAASLFNPHIARWLAPQRSAVAADAAASTAATVATSERTALQWCVRPVDREELWDVASVHCEAFHPTANALTRGVLRWDRVMALQLGKQLDESSDESGRFLCLVAEADGGVRPLGMQHTAAVMQLAHHGTAWHSHTAQQVWPLQTQPIVSMLRGEWRLRGSAAPAVAAAQPSNILAAIVVDNLGEHVPRLQKKLPGGRVVTVKRHDVAYISNLAVSAAARRRGIGGELLSTAEATARQWGCDGAALHVDSRNAAAIALYTRDGYRVPREGDNPFNLPLPRPSPYGAPLFQSQSRLVLMVKRL